MLCDYLLVRNSVVLRSISPVSFVVAFRAIPRPIPLFLGSSISSCHRLHMCSDDVSGVVLRLSDAAVVPVVVLVGELPGVVMVPDAFERCHALMQEVRWRASVVGVVWVCPPIVNLESWSRPSTDLCSI